MKEMGSESDPRGYPGVSMSRVARFPVGVRQAFPPGSEFRVFRNNKQGKETMQWLARNAIAVVAHSIEIGQGLFPNSVLMI